MFKAATLWAPNFFQVVNTVYSRANMIASDKMFLANAVPTAKCAWFWWNPLFHVIDQDRCFVFLNHHPHDASIIYPIHVTLGFLILG